MASQVRSMRRDRARKANALFIASLLQGIRFYFTPPRVAGLKPEVVSGLVVRNEMLILKD